MKRRPSLELSRDWPLWAAVVALTSHACGPDGGGKDEDPGLPDGAAAGQHGDGGPGSGGRALPHSGGSDAGGADAGGVASHGDGGTSSGGEASSGGTDGSGAGGHGGDHSGGNPGDGGSSSGGETGAGGDPGSGGSGGTTDPGPVNNCEVFFDRTAPGASREIPWDFGISDVDERCLRIAIGQSVTFEGTFTTHPLGPLGGDQPNPITGDYPSGALEYTVDFSAPGTFGYYCLTHTTMRGAIEVVP